ncbi:hypothetical protein FRS32_09200 [Campylobacter coli]|nr:hypothetical protein [Campylobacter coli]
MLNLYLFYRLFIGYLYVFLNSFCTKPKHFPPPLFFAYPKPFLVLKRNLKEFLIFYSFLLLHQ